MSEHRKPDIVMLIRPKHTKKSTKMELFRGTKWPGGPADKYRLRVNGKFWPDPRDSYSHDYFSLEEISGKIQTALERSLA